MKFKFSFSLILSFFFFCHPLLTIFSMPLGKNVLALYKSSEGQTEKENEILWYLKPAINKLGLTIKFHDIDESLPDYQVMRDVRAIVTWFRGSVMIRPAIYLEFLKKKMDEGYKVIMLGNMGAYQDRGTFEFVNAGVINATLSRLGLYYFGDWTDDAGKIRLAFKDKTMVEYQGAQNCELSRYYYRFAPADKNLRIYLSLLRTDKDYQPSPVITTNRNGGFALDRYIYRQNNSSQLFLLNLDAFLKESLFPPPNEERIALISDFSNPKLAQAAKCISETLSQAKLPYELIGLYQAPEFLSGDFRRFTTVALVLKDDAGLDSTLFEDYLSEGGSVISFISGNFSRMASILALSNESAVGSKAKGYRFLNGFLLGEGLALENRELNWQCGTRLPVKEAEILATSLDSKIPLLWSMPMAKGKVLVWNWDVFIHGEDQGMILESFLAVRPVGVAAMAGVGILFIDSWPLPLSDTVRPPLNVTDTEFFARNWWPDIKKLLNSYKIPVNGSLLLSNNENIASPFTSGDFIKTESGTTVNLANAMLLENEEFGLYGYNPVPFIRKGNSLQKKGWPSGEIMEEALIQTKRDWTALFGEQILPFSYVAPRNIYSEEGINAILRIFPSIRIISGALSSLDDDCVMKLGVYKYKPDVYQLPRTSWGYIFSPVQRKAIVSSVSGLGLWSHYIKSDEIFEVASGQGYNWNELLSDFKEILYFVQYNYPWLKYCTARQAYLALQEYDNQYADFRWDSDELIIKCTPGLLFRIRMNDYIITQFEGVDLIYDYQKLPVLVLKATAPYVRLRFEKPVK